MDIVLALMDSRSRLDPLGVQLFRLMETDMFMSAY